MKPIEGEVLPKRKKSTKYETWMCEKLIEVAEEGGHVANMCKAIGIRSKDTFYRWLNEYPEFKEAYNESRLASQAFHEQMQLMGALGKIPGFNSTTFAMIMNNKFSDDYKRGTGAGASTEINIGSINSIDTLDSDGLDTKIKSLQKKLGLLPTEENKDEH